MVNNSEVNHQPGIMDSFWKDNEYKLNPNSTYNPEEDARRILALQRKIETFRALIKTSGSNLWKKIRGVDINQQGPS